MATYSKSRRIIDPTASQLHWYSGSLWGASTFMNINFGVIFSGVLLTVAYEASCISEVGIHASRQIHFTNYRLAGLFLF